MKKFFRTVVLYIISLNKIRLIAESKVFNKAYYIQRYKLKRYKYFPIFHYLVIGEKRGYQPSENFDPKLYQLKHPGLAGDYLVHYLKHNDSQFYIAVNSSERQLQTVEAFEKPNKIAVVFHVYYPDLIEEVANKIKNISIAYDIIVTLVEGNVVETKNKIKKLFPESKVYIFPNHGRDIYPFFHLINSGVLDAYKAVCKVHTKKSLHRGHNGDVWRKELLAGILNSNLMTRIIDTVTNQDCGIIVSDNQLKIYDRAVDKNDVMIKRLCDEHAIKYNSFMFPQGSMYWINARVILKLKKLNINEKDFSIENGQIDGEMHHALERMVGLITVNEGMKLLEVKDLKGLY